MRKLATCIVLACIMSGSPAVHAQKFFKKGIAAGKQQAQNSAIGTSMWSAVPLDKAPAKSLLRTPPSKYLVYSLNVAAMRAQLWGLTANAANTANMKLPMPDGTLREFKVWESSMMPASLAAQFPNIKTFTAEAVNDARVTAKIDFTEFGFHSVVFDGEQVAFIDPYDNLNDGYYVVHYKADENRPFSQRMVCAVHGDQDDHAGGEPMQIIQSKLPGTDLKQINLPASLKGTQGEQGKSVHEAGVMAELTTNGTNIRTYDIAVSANSFYCQAATGLGSPTVAQCLSRVTTTMNRVNGVYNRELAVQFNFVAGESSLIWPTATGSVNGPDPFASLNTNPGGCLSQNQTTCDAVIGSANYDVGHVFTTGAGGLASLGIICNNSFKAQGVTGSSSPVGDAYDIDYVCHELGHQFGSNHTFNNNVDGGCNPNASSANAFEPGSGATIMDYAGLCSPDNLQSNSSPYFSARSLDRIQLHISGSGGACAASSASGHVPPVFSGTFSATYNIPYKTPFELTSPTPTVTAGDTAVTYCWHQANLGDFGRRLNQTFIFGPIFRSYQPVYTTTRIFPQLSTILAGALSNSGEKAPDTTRFLTFKTVVRSIRAGMGAIIIPDDTIHINAGTTGAANGYAGFRVTSQNTTGIVYTGNTTQTITWNRVGTNLAPVSCANVDIFMSTDGGQTWAYTIGTFPNSGTASVTLPNPPVSSSTCRIKVKGNGNIFFNINSNNFTVNPGVITAPITGTFTVCVGATTALADATPGGTWSSGNTAVATVGSLTGSVFGVAAGTAGITYTAPSGPVSVVVTVIATPVPAPITGATGVCTGLTASVSNATPGGVWSSSSPAQATISALGVVSGLSAGTTTISYGVTNTCGTGYATSVMTVSAPTAVAAITGTAGICNGTTTTLSNTTPSGVWSSVNTAVATISAGGGVNGLSAGTSTISYSVTNGFGCVSAATTVVTVNAVPVATTTPSGAVAICTGGSQLISASPASGGFTYQWQDAGIDIPGETNATYNATAAGTFRVRITSAASCVATSAVVTVTESGTAIVPSVSIGTTPGTTICSAVGTVTFTATPVNGGSAPGYQWFVNDVAVAATASSYAYAPANGDEVKCELSSSLACASPTTVADSIIMTVNPSVTPGVTVNPAPNDTVCIGQIATYTAVAVNGGTAPTYQWVVNGFNVATGPSYTATPATGDVVFCTMTSNAVCRTTSAVTSDPLVMTVQAPASNTVNISASSPSIVAGESVTFVAVALNAGPGATYEWFINGTSVPGATNATFTTNTITNGQTIHCKVTSALPCVLPHIALSPGFTMIVTSGLQEVTGSGNAFALSPNPNKGSFAITGRLTTALEHVGISVVNVLGQSVTKTEALVNNGKMYEQVTLPAGLAKGIYLITLTAGSEYVTFRMILE